MAPLLSPFTIERLEVGFLRLEVRGWMLEIGGSRKKLIYL